MISLKAQPKAEVLAAHRQKLLRQQAAREEQIQALQASDDYNEVSYTPEANRIAIHAQNSKTGLDARLHLRSEPDDKDFAEPEPKREIAVTLSNDRPRLSRWKAYEPDQYKVSVREKLDAAYREIEKPKRSLLKLLSRST